MDIHKLAHDMLDQSMMWRSPKLPFKATLHPGNPRVLVVAGENCAGKSFFVESLRAWARTLDILNICISIRERTGSGTHEMASMRRTMMFGDESTHSTGATSVKVLDSAFSNMLDRHQAGHRALLVLDEPELGLSEGYARALGTLLARKVATLPESACGLAVVTHSRGLVSAMAEEMRTEPSFAHLGGGAPLDRWLVDQEPRSVEELLSLAERDRATHQQVRDLVLAVNKAPKRRSSAT